MWWIIGSVCFMLGFGFCAVVHWVFGCLDDDFIDKVAREWRDYRYGGKW
jgi:hypothetical protein